MIIMNNIRIRVTAWNNGDFNQTGSGYGVRLSINNRDTIFQDHRWDTITLVIEGVEFEITLNDTFWTTCPEFRDQRIGQWLIRNNFGAWNFGEPPSVWLVRIGERRFQLEL